MGKRGPHAQWTPSVESRQVLIVLLEIRLHNLAVAAEVTLQLGEGLNVLSGSTGAGKSLVVEAIRWIRGEKIDPGLLRSGERAAWAEALFDLSSHPQASAVLDRHGIAASSDAILVLRREWNNGRSRAWVNARLASAALLEAICDELIEVQSQHQQLALLDRRAHVQWLDGNRTARQCLQEWREAFEALRQTRARIQRHRERQRLLRDQSDLLRYQLRELQEAEIDGSEMATLRAEVARLEGGARLAEHVEEATLRLSDEEIGALAQLRRSQAALEPCSEAIDEIAEAREKLFHAVELVDELCRDLELFGLDRELSPELLDEKQRRLTELESLCRKYGRNESELVDLRDRLLRDVGSLDDGQELPAELEAEDREVRARLQQLGVALQKARRREARHIEREAAPLLEELGMPGAALRFDFEGQVADPADDAATVQIDGRPVVARADGPTAVRLLVRTNPGEGFGPVEQTASGGELSRIGLVLRSIAAGHHHPTLLLLDEVDAGLGADLGPALARRLRALADASQVLVITHLPAVAAAADLHLLATKTTDGHRTTTEIRALSDSDREEELLRMIGGEVGPGRELVRELRRAPRSRREKA